MPQNRFLTALPAAVQSRLIPDLKQVSLTVGTVLFESEEHLFRIYFPNDSIISLCSLTRSGAQSEMSVVGAEGLVGMPALMGGSSLSRAVVLNPGSAYQIAASSLKREFDRHEDFLVLTMRYMQSLVTQTAQIAACNRHHSIDQQLCRWLLHVLDRLPGNRVTLSQEAIAKLLGVRRESVSAGAVHLQRQGVIQCRHGQIMVNRRRELEARSCECYAVVKKECSRLMQGVAA